MKKVLYVFLVLMISLLTVNSVSEATSIPGGPLSSAINIQNIGSAEAAVTVQYYTAVGTLAHTSSHTIAVDDVLFVYVPNVSELASGEYSVVISSDQPIAAISNFSDSDSGASYSGFDTGATTWFIPAAYDNYYGYYSEVYAQNISGSSADITLEVFAPGSSTSVYTNTKTAVPANTSVEWSQAGLSELNNNVPYSAKVTSTGDVVAMANIYGSGGTEQQLYSYNGFPSGAIEFFTPVVMKNYHDWNVAIAIQNVSASAASVTVDYSTGQSKNYTIQPNSSESIYAPAEIDLPNGLFSATITSDQDIAVMVNQSNNYNRAATYNGVWEATTVVNAPNVMKRYYNYSSSITCQNLGTTDTTMTINYANQPSASKTSDIIPSGDSWIIYLPSEGALPDNFNGSAVITSNTAAPITCIINSNMDEAPYNTQMMDQLYSYNGVNK